MGHYASEMSDTWDDSIDNTDKIIKLKNQIAKMPLSKFKAEDTRILCDLFHITRWTQLADDELDQLKSRF